ncbi:outer membrane protein transport protein [Gammaproteobacteria bacterium]|nr:outer membrane protein transport protein [Gammaproteobacteria bacterium]
MNKNLVAGAAILCALPTLSQGSGFALIEMNARGQGNAYAGAAAHTPDASTVYFNPAGMMKLEEDQIGAALHVIMPSASFDNDGSTAAQSLGGGPLLGDDDDGGADAFVPNFYWVKTINDEMKFGLGVNTPFGLETSYDDEWVGRYHGVLSDLRTVNINPSLGYRVNKQLSIGGGLNFMLGEVDLSNAVDFGAVCVGVTMNPATCAGAVSPSSLPQEADGKAEFEADNFDNISTGFNLGLLYQVTPQTSIGVAYRSEVEMKVKGEVDFTVPAQLSTAPIDLTSTGLFVDGDIRATVDLPASMSFSLSHQVDKFTWLADVTWTGWSSFDELRIKYDNGIQPDSVTTEDWDDTMRYSVGLDYQYSDQWVLRTGLALDETPVPNKERRTPRLPGNDRTWLSFGATYLQSKTLSWDFGYSHLFIDDARIDNEFESSASVLEATLSGDYEADVDIISVQMNWKY